MQEDGASVTGRIFRSGEYAYGSFFVNGFARKPAPEQSSEDVLISLEYQVRVLDPEGVPIQKEQSGQVRDRIREQDKDWRPKIRFQLLLPPAPPSGTYHVEIHVKDDYASREATAQIPFDVKGYDAPKVSELTIANFRFQRTDRANEAPLASPSYSIGDSVWVRFDVGGFQLGPKNRYDVALGLAVLDSSGKVLFEQPDAVQLSEEPEYPKRGLPGVLSVQVAPGTAKAEYQFRVTAKDRVGDKTAEYTGRFRVE